MAQIGIMNASHQPGLYRRHTSDPIPVKRIYAKAVGPGRKVEQ